MKKLKESLFALACGVFAVGIFYAGYWEITVNTPRLNQRSAHMASVCQKDAAEKATHLYEVIESGMMPLGEGNRNSYEEHPAYRVLLDNGHGSRINLVASYDSPGYCKLVVNDQEESWLFESEWYAVLSQCSNDVTVKFVYTEADPVSADDIRSGFQDSFCRYLKPHIVAPSRS